MQNMGEIDYINIEFPLPDNDHLRINIWQTKDFEQCAGLFKVNRKGRLKRWNAQTHRYANYHKCGSAFFTSETKPFVEYSAMFRDGCIVTESLVKTR